MHIGHADTLSKRQSSIVSVAIVLALLGGCGEGGPKRVQRQWLRPYSDYALTLETLTRAGQPIVVRPIVDQRGNCFEDLGLSACVSTQRYGFWLDITNKRTKPISLVWPEAKYVDERSIPRAVYAQPMGPLPGPEKMKAIPSPWVIRPDERSNPVVAPAYKSINVRYGGYERGPYNFALIPTNLDNVQAFPDEASVKRYVEDIAARQVPVKLVLPIEIDGVRYDYTFTFVLKRWSDVQPKA